MGSKCFSVRNESDNKTDSIITVSPNTKELPELHSLKHIPNFPINSRSREIIISAFSQNYLFCELSQLDINSLLQKLFYCVAEEDKTIVQCGTQGSLFFIINSGQVDVIVNGEVKKSLQQGDCFGELALLSNSVRKASIKTLCKSSFWVLSGESFSATLKKMYEKTFDKNRKLISSTLMFRSLSSGQVDEISRLAKNLIFQDQERIIEEGMIEESLYVLKSGKVAFYKGNQKVHEIDISGEMFGEGSVLNKGKRMASCFSVGLVEVITIHSDILKGVLGDRFEEIILKSVAKSSILSDTYLKFLSDKKINELCDALSWQKYKDKEVVILRKYQKITTFRVIGCGMLATKDPLVPTIRPYSVIGMGNELEKSLKTQNYYSQGESIIGEIQIEDLNKLLQIDTKSLCEIMEKIQFVYSISFFSDLSLDSVRIICTKMQRFRVMGNTQIYELNDKSTKTYLVRSGVFQLCRNDGTVIRLVMKNEVFGECCLYEAFRPLSVSCIQDGEMFTVGRSILKTLPEYPMLLKEARRKLYYRKKINLSSMIITDKLFVDQEREQYCIQDRSDGSSFRLIIIKKSFLHSSKECNRLVSEKNIMLQIEHKSLLKIVDTAFDRHNIYFITELTSARPLKSLLPLRMKHIDIVIVHLIKIFEYLHSRDIVYRDLCPENILVSSKALPYLWNFKNTVRVKNRCYSKVGDPFYQSPEMIMGRGYTKATDIWSLGVVVCEMVTRKLPFGVKRKDGPMDAYEKIINMEMDYGEIKDESVVNFLKGMLCKSGERWDANLLMKKFWVDDGGRELIFKSKLALNERVFEKNRGRSPTYRPFSVSRMLRDLTQVVQSKDVEEFAWETFF